jgi:hypothetical protein
VQLLLFTYFECFLNLIKYINTMTVLVETRMTRQFN